MFHLLPEKEKKILKKEYYLRLAIVGLFFILGSLVVASVFLFPSYILSERKLQDVTNQNNQIKADIKQKTDPAMSSFLSSLKDNLSALKPTQKTASSTVYIREITDKKTTGISIDQFSITRGDNETIIIGGNADTRDHLTRFFRDLQSIPDFSNIDLPISAFAKDKDIDFTITITVKNIS